MSTKFIEVLRDIEDHGGIRVWDKNKKHPSTTLKSLAHHGLVEVETHSISTWTYGRPFPSGFGLGGYGSKEHKEAVQEVKQFNAKLEPQKWWMRAEVWARITTDGRAFLREHGVNG